MDNETRITMESLHSIMVRAARIMTAQTIPGLGCGLTAMVGMIHHNHGSASIGDMSEQLGVSKSRIGKMAKTLESKGYVTIDQSPDDGRSRLVSLTPSAVDELHEYMESSRADMEKALETVPHDDIESLIRTANAIMESLETSMRTNVDDKGDTGSSVPGHGDTYYDNRREGNC